MIPRIRGKVGQCSDPIEHKGKWFFEMWMTTLGGGEGDSLGIFGPWETEDIAHAELKRACQIACEAAEEALTGEKSGAYIDMKTNILRKFDRSDEN